MNITWKKLVIYPLIPLVAAATMSACSSDSDSGSAPVTTAATAPTDAPGPTDAPATTETPAPTETTEGTDSSTTTSNGGEGDCFVHLYDGDDFDTADDNFKLTEAGRYATLDGLPGAELNWNDEADGIEVGDGATVTIWEGSNFEGPSQELAAGSQNTDIEEPSSMELTCN